MRGQTVLKGIKEKTDALDFRVTGVPMEPKAQRVLTESADLKAVLDSQVLKGQLDSEG